MHNDTHKILPVWVCGVTVRAAKHHDDASVLLHFLVKLRQSFTNTGGKPRGTHDVGEDACPKVPLRSHCRAPKVSSSFIIGQNVSEVGLSSSGVGVAKKKKMSKRGVR